MNEKKKQIPSFSVLFAILGVIITFFGLYVVGNYAFKMDFYGGLYYDLGMIVFGIAIELFGLAMILLWKK